MANPKFQQALHGTNRGVPPVWMMRQAGRYHQHYQKLRAKHSFMDLCKKPELAAEVALGPIEDFDFDVSILFSDLLFPLEALGLGLTYDPAPKLAWHLRDEKDLLRLKDHEKALPALLFQGEAMRQTRQRLPQEKSLIGFVGSPWTLFVYAVVGSHKDSLTDAKIRMPLFHKFAELILPLLIANIRLQFEGGAELVMLFDTAAGELSAQQFNQWVAPHLQTLAHNFPNRLGYYSKHTVAEHLDPQLAFMPWAGFGYDHRWDLTKRLPSAKGFVQGNFDQSLLFLPEREFEKTLRDYLTPFQKLSEAQRGAWVCGLGHGVLPQTPENNVRRFVQIVRESF